MNPTILSTDDSKTIGEKLGVYYLLEGSVRKSADRVRIAVELDEFDRLLTRFLADTTATSIENG